MSRYQLIQRLQNSILTRWIWVYWQHDEYGRLTVMPFWKSPGRRWSRIKLKETDRG